MERNGEQQSEKRAAYRVACDVPVVVRHSADKRGSGSLSDLSRLGVCLRIPGDLLGVHRLSSLVQVARQVANVLGPRFDAWLGGADGVARTLEPVRICQRNWESRDVELGCSLNRPLSDKDLASLGVEAPPLKGAGSATTASGPRWTAGGGTPVRANVDDRVPLGATGVSEPTHVGYVVPETSYDGRTLQGRTQFLTEQEAVLVIPAFERSPFANMDIATMVMAFGESYGDRPTFQLLDGTKSLWAGSVRLTEVEAPSNGSGAMRLRVQFEDPLSTEQRQVLGVS